VDSTEAAEALRRPAGRGVTPTGPDRWRDEKRDDPDEPADDTDRSAAVRDDAGRRGDHGRLPAGRPAAARGSRGRARRGDLAALPVHRRVARVVKASGPGA
jgi:hypothetical protein